MSLKKENDPFSYLFKQFSSLEFKEHQTIKSLILNYYPLNKDEEIFIKDISIKDKNEFISQIKKIFHELSISMETIEYLFNEYYHFITNNKVNPFGPLQKSEVINKLGINSSMFKKILELYFNILYELKNDKEKKVDNKMEIEKDEKKKEEKEKDKKFIEQKMININALSKEMKGVFDDYYKNKKELNNKDNKKTEENKNDKIYGNINLTPEEEENLLKKLEGYENSIV